MQPRTIALGVLGLVLVLATSAAATDRLILGKQLLVKDPTASEPQRKVVVLGRETSTDIVTLTDPGASGATLRVITNGVTASDQTYVLDMGGWVPVANGYKYTGPTGGDGDPVKKVLLKRTPGNTALLKVIIKGSLGTQSLDVVPPNTGTDGGVILDVTGGDRYCVAFGGAANGTEVQDVATMWKVINATAQPGCPSPPPTTTTSTTSTTSTTDTSTTSTTSTTTPGTQKLVFITSGTYTGNLGGLAGADATCSTVASGALLPGVYRAWVSDSTGDVTTRFTHAAVPYVRVDSTTIANYWADLTDGTLAAPINVTETGGTVASGQWAWTETKIDGTLNNVGVHCTDWTSTSGVAGFGDANVVTLGWTENYLNNCSDPSAKMHLYCFEQ